jgi:ribosome-associated translation inhibitor RaiA
LQRPVQITFRGMTPSESVEARIRDKVAHLEHVCDRIVGCHVVVDAPHHHQRKGNLNTVAIEVSLPGAPPILVTHPHHDVQSHEDLYVAIRDAFDAARRRVQHYMEKRMTARHADM